MENLLFLGVPILKHIRVFTTNHHLNIAKAEQELSIDQDHTAAEESAVFENKRSVSV